RYLARALRDLGVDLYRTTTIGDNEERIAAVIRDAMQRSEIVITTGGLGPTVDDPTRQAVASALGVELVYSPALWEQIQSRMIQRYGRQPSPNNMRQAWIPAGSIPVSNPVGTAPAFIGEQGEACVISLPGVPREMEYLYQNEVIPYLKKRYQLSGLIKARVLHTAGVGESQIDEWIGDLERLHNPTVGLLAHPGQCDIRITAKAASLEEADRMIAEIEADIRTRCGAAIYGADTETLESVVFKLLAQQGWRMAALECGLAGELRARLIGAGLAPDLVRVESTACPGASLAPDAAALADSVGVDIVLATSYLPGDDKQEVGILVHTPGGDHNHTRFYGGPPQLGAAWAVHTALDYLRRTLTQ
ncbi:MAG: competence/damage-inducible protein A, partial [Anaerolineae bacterium]|nr:competence/damage-inducible protein A [Anaerolineae bacterium]